MSSKLIFLWTDSLLYVLTFFFIGLAFYFKRKLHLMIAWKGLMQKPIAIASLILLIAFYMTALLDSIHFQQQVGERAGVPIYSVRVSSVLDLLLSPLGQQYEKTYSAPFAYRSFTKEAVMLGDGKIQQTYPHLQYAGFHVHNSLERNQQIRHIVIYDVIRILLLSVVMLFVILITIANRRHVPVSPVFVHFLNGKTRYPWRTIMLTLFLLSLFIFLTLHLSSFYHIFGTDKVGADVFYQTVKSIRTGLIVGTLATLVMLPFAVLLGLAAGYYGGRVDDVIQYIYTTLSAVPSVLLIAASILSLQVYMSQHTEGFTILAQRADARLLALCIILGVTSWSSLCRLIRAETLKIREMDYVQAAKVMGTPSLLILLRHILPNVMHVIIIAVALDFSALVLAEAILSYVGVGVSPMTLSWGNMINTARLELARDPIVWWPILAAFTFMFTLVLSANCFSDGLRDAFDPRLRHE